MIRGQRGVEHREEGRRQGHAQPGEGGGRAQERARLEGQRAEGTPHLPQQVAAAQRRPRAEERDAQQPYAASPRRRGFVAPCDEGQDGEAGQEDEGGDLGDQRRSERCAEDDRPPGRRPRPEPMSGEDRGQRGACKRHLRRGQARMRDEVGIERGAGHGQRRRHRPHRPARGVHQAQEKGQPEDGGGAGEEAQRSRIGHPGRARRFPREHARQHDRGLGVEPFLAGALADPAVEEPLRPLQMEPFLVVRPPLLARRPQGVADRPGGEGQGQHLRPPPCPWLDVRGPRAHGGQRAPVRRLAGGTPRILHTRRTAPCRTAP